MSHEQTIRVVGDALRDQFAALDAWLDRPDEFLRDEPRSGWTAGQVLILEHIALTNRYLMLTLAQHAQRHREQLAAIAAGFAAKPVRG